MLDENLKYNEIHVFKIVCPLYPEQLSKVNGYALSRHGLESAKLSLSQTKANIYDPLLPFGESFADCGLRGSY